MEGGWKIHGLPRLDSVKAGDAALQEGPCFDNVREGRQVVIEEG